MYMKAPYKSEVRSVHGHILVAEAGDVLWVPPVVQDEARRIGWQPTGEPVEVEAPTELSDNVTESPSLEEDEFQVELDQAVLRVMTRNVESDFKPDGVPKVNAVVAEMSPDVRRPTAGQILKVFERFQDNIDLADD